tara:strand:+ start:839 stop:1057 length:219 start_codon:yes stop_codon:yes gene_type:complete
MVTSIKENNMINIIIGVVIGVLLMLIWLIYEIVTAPLMPDDYEETIKYNKNKDGKVRLLNKHDKDPEWDKLK